MAAQQPFIGRVTRCSTRGFVGAVRLPEPHLPAFGSFCQAEAQQGLSRVFGLIYNISIEDDDFARQIASIEHAPPEEILDNQQNRQVPVEFHALTIGYEMDGKTCQTLPPQPPLTLAPIHVMPDAMVESFTRKLDFLTLILNSSTIPADELVAAALGHAARIRAQADQEEFLITAGRQCARMLSRDLIRLETILKGLHNQL